MKRFSPTVAILICSMILLIVSGSLIYRNENRVLRKESKLYLDRALSVDMSNRLKETDSDLIYAHTFDNSSDSTYIRNNDSITFPENIASSQLSINSKFQNVIQSFLLHKNPININTLDSLFLSILGINNISAQTMLRYIDNTTKQIYESELGSKISTPIYAFDNIYLGLQNEITIQGFVKLSPLCVISKAKRQFTIVYSTLFLLAGILIFIVSRRKIGYIVPSTGEYNITKDISFDMDKLSLRHRDENIALTPQSAKIFKLLLESPDYFIGYEELGHAMWGNLEKARDRRDKAINRLRESLEPIPNLHIACVWTSGYQLIIGSKQDVEKAETSASRSTNESNKPGSFIKRLFVGCKLPFLQH